MWFNGFSAARRDTPRPAVAGSRRHRGKIAQTHRSHVSAGCSGRTLRDRPRATRGRIPEPAGPWPCGTRVVGSDPRDRPGIGGAGPDHLILTVAPASSSSFLSFSASSLEMPVLISLGAASTRSLASLRPRAVAARTTLMTLILLAPMASRTTSNSVFGGGGLGRGGGGGGAGDRHGGGGRLDPVNDLEVVAQGLGFQDGQVDDRLAQGLDVIGERRGFGGGHRGSGPFLLSRSDHDHCRGVRQTHRVSRNRKTARVRIRRTLPGMNDGRCRRGAAQPLAVAVQRRLAGRRLGRPASAGLLAAGPFGDRLELAHQVARRRVGQGQRSAAPGPAPGATTRPINSSRLGSLVMSSTWFGPDHHPVDGAPLDLRAS